MAKGKLPASEYQSWIKPVILGHQDDARRQLVLGVPDTSHGAHLEEAFGDFFHRELEKLGKGDYQITFKPYDEALDASAASGAAVSRGRREEPVSIAPEALREDQGTAMGLNPRYSFENFVDGPTNQFALSAASAVADEPGGLYNPLFIFGGVGLGKTHLLHAIGHAVLERHPDKRVHYVTSERFVNDLIHAIQSKRMDDFRAFYRDGFDVLLVDDIQFLAGKDRSQEEFFHLFNTLHTHQKQIVMTCDQSPHTIARLEDRLSSRLSWGLTADIKPPGLETRVAIVKTKAASEGVNLDNDVAMMIARQATRNVRELEGALLKVLATGKLLGRTIDAALCQQALGPLLGEAMTPVSPDEIIQRVAEAFKVTVTDMKGPRRHRSITVPRQIAMYLMRELTEASLSEIGGRFGGRDHSTVLYSIKRIENLRDADPDTRATMEGIRQKIRG